MLYMYIHVYTCIYMYIYKYACIYIHVYVQEIQQNVYNLIY